ncbi:zona pellucida sperm-binding protein 3-like [Brachyistius frenatus]|uniref:zona pellucida sperm-binding protein 3-like n=1 Tax=Brachyistius frenatus TaxID=100188 RepID=UPI0037E7C904
MVTAGHSAILVLRILFAFGGADAIRSLKDGPMIDAEGREYKSAALRIDAENIGRRTFDESPPVRVYCTEGSMIVVVKADLYKSGRLVSPRELFLGDANHLGSSPCQAVAAGNSEYVIKAPLQDCGSKLTISEDAVIYSNKLIFSPAVGYHGITRMAGAVVPVSCHYKRTHVVSSHLQQPPPSIPAKYSTGSSAFSLKLMNDDWTSEMFSSNFFLGALLRLEASYTGPNPGQRRLFIDSCVATLTPNATTIPRYYFIKNHGCLTDAKQVGSNTLLRPRTRANSLQLQLDTFLFQKDPRNSVFITCQLKATPEMWRNSPINKACNYVHSRWRSVDGNNGVCQCCDSICHKRSTKDIMPCGTVTLGPLMIFHRK